VYITYRFIKNYLKTKKAERDAKAKDEAERPERERKAKELQEKQKEEGDALIQTGNDAFKALMANEKPTWNDIFHLTENGFRQMSDIPFEIILKPGLKNLIEVSDIKNQIKWERGFETVIEYFNKVISSSFNDHQLRQCIDQVNELKAYKTRKSYYGLKNVIKNRCSVVWNLSDLIDKEVPAALIENN
jgi:hypothetical protein